MEDTNLVVNEAEAPLYYSFWLREYGNEFLTFVSTVDHTFDTRNRTLFPDSGLLSRLSAEIAFPGGDLEYYKASYNMRWYKSFHRHMALLLGGEVAYGDGYGDTTYLPFFENYFAGGIRSVRGFRQNTIGPKGIDCRLVDQDDGHGGTVTTRVCTADYSIGGNAKFQGRTELIFSNPFEDAPSRNFRLSAFIDFARVYTNIDTAAIVPDDRLRASYGLGAVWITPVGALNFSLAWPLISYEGDRTEVFAFNIGSPF